MKWKGRRGAKERRGRKERASVLLPFSVLAGKLLIPDHRQATSELDAI